MCQGILDATLPTSSSSAKFACISSTFLACVEVRNSGSHESIDAIVYNDGPRLMMYSIQVQHKSTNNNTAAFLTSPNHNKPSTNLAMEDLSKLKASAGERHLRSIDPRFSHRPCELIVQLENNPQIGPGKVPVNSAASKTDSSHVPRRRWFYC